MRYDLTEQGEVTPAMLASLGKNVGAGKVLLTEAQFAGMGRYFTCERATLGEALSYTQLDIEIVK